MRQHRFHVVLVEDDPADAEIFRIALAQADADIELRHFEAGNEILDYFGMGAAPACDGVKGCDLVLLDINLPVMSGFDVLERMRSEARFQALPIVIMSGSSDPEEIARCHRLGATKYIRKPSQLTEIFAVGHEIVEMLRACG